MAKKKTRQPFSDADYVRHRREQAAERQRRGMHTFTRPSVREEVMGETPGENKMQTTHRYSQVKRKQSKK